MIMSSLPLALFAIYISLKSVMTDCEIEIRAISMDPMYPPTRAHMMAFDEINADPNILPNCKLIFKQYDASRDQETALYHAMDVGMEINQCLNTNNSRIISPIVLGCPWSSFSVLTSRVFNIYNLLQISSSSTCPCLSNKNKYESFIRTISSDTLQGKALIKLCKHFNWTRIGIVYVNDDFGVGLHDVIEAESGNHIEVKSKPFELDNTKSMKAAAQFIQDNNLYITIVISHGADLYELFNVFNKSNITGYPHYYIGVESWFDEIEIKQNNITDLVTGYIGTMPGTLSMLTQQQYKLIYPKYNGDINIYNTAKGKIEQMYNIFGEDYQNIMPFAVDAAYVLANALHEYNETQALHTMFDGCDLSKTQQTLKDIIYNITFNGATGPIAFDSNGDRIGGLFLYGNLDQNGNMVIFGGMSDQTYSINDSLITWPAVFLNRNHIPWSKVSTIEDKQGVDLNLIVIFGVISFVFSISSVALSVKSQSITETIVTVGFFLHFMYIINYGFHDCVDLYKESLQYWYDISCNVNLWLICIIGTLWYLPLFVSKTVTYLNNQHIIDEHDTLRKIKWALKIDFLILISFTIIEVIYYITNDTLLLHFQFVDSGVRLNSNDILEELKVLKPSCQTSTDIPIGIIIIVKFIQMYYVVNMLPYSGVVCVGYLTLVVAIWYIIQIFSNNNMQYIMIAISIVSMNLLWITYALSKFCKKYRYTYVHALRKETMANTVNMDRTNSSPEQNTTSSMTSTPLHSHLNSAEQHIKLQMHQDGGKYDGECQQEEVTVLQEEDKDDVAVANN